MTDTIFVKLSEVSEDEQGNIRFPDGACLPFRDFEYVYKSDPALSSWEYDGLNGVTYVVINQ